MKRFIEGEGRDQVTLLPECLDDFIGQDNSVRIVDAFDDELDLRALGFNRAAPASTLSKNAFPHSLGRKQTI